MARPRPKPRIENVTRNELIQGAARKLIDIAVEQGTNGDFYYDRLEVMVQMQLITDLHLVVTSNGKPTGGATLHFDWVQHTAIIEAEGEFMNSGILNQYGEPDSITDTFEAVRSYISGLCRVNSHTQVWIWYTINQDRIREMGIDRVDQLLDAKKFSDQEQKIIHERWNDVTRARSAKTRNRFSVFRDLREAALKIW